MKNKKLTLWVLTYETKSGVKGFASHATRKDARDSYKMVEDNSVKLTNLKIVKMQQVAGR